MEDGTLARGSVTDDDELGEGVDINTKLVQFVDGAEKLLVVPGNLSQRPSGGGGRCHQRGDDGLTAWIGSVRRKVQVCSQTRLP